MAGGIGTFFGKALLAKLLGATNFTPPATWYAALLTATCSDAGGGTEVTGGSYARVAVTNNTTNFPAPGSSAEIDTGTTTDWGTATANWGTITTIAYYDALTVGNLGVWGPLSVPSLVNNGGSFKITTGNGAILMA